MRASIPSLMTLVMTVACSIVRATMAGEIVNATVESDIVPSPVEYSVLLPDGYAEMKTPLPLIFELHGGGGDRSNLERGRKVYEDLWASGELPPAVVVTPSVTPRCFYMDFLDGKEKWETFLAGPFLEHLRSKYNVRRDREGTLLTGASMGGMGSLRLAFKYPDRFLAVAALEPGIEPILEFSQMRPKHRFWRSDELMEAAYGKPVDQAYWALNNPATIAAREPSRLIASGLKIYVEAGDEDQFWLYEGAEFLHRTLWDARIKHEYHLVLGADHVGTSISDRRREGLRFLARAMKPWEQSPRSVSTTATLAPLKARIDEVDHYSEKTP